MKRNKENTLDNWEKLRQGAGADSQYPLGRIWDGSASYGEDFQPDVEAGLKRLKGRIQADAQPARVVSLTSRFGWLMRAAAVAVLAVVAISIYSYISEKPQAGTWTTVATAADEVREVILPDGSVVSLNEQTRLSYNTDINTADTRSIQLEGEAFFDVKRNPEQPFVIRTQRAEVKVLGTSFNVRALAGSQRTEVEVTSGKVAVRGLEAQEETVILEANDAVVVDADYQVYTEDNSPLNSNAWRTGELRFRASDLASALHVIERTYDVDLQWEDAAIEDCTITGNWTTESFADVLLLLEGLTGMKISNLGGNAYQLSGSCQ